MPPRYSYSTIIQFPVAFAAIIGLTVMTFRMRRELIGDIEDGKVELFRGYDYEGAKEIEAKIKEHQLLKSQQTP